MKKIDITSLKSNLHHLNYFEANRKQKAFWDDEHISAKMLEAHLNPDWDAASRKSEFIDNCCHWLVDYFSLNKDHMLLDLGCGPGLYCTKLSQMGLNVTGIDYSKRSIEYAREKAYELELPIRYIYDDYLNIEDRNIYDVAMMIYCDFGVFSYEDSSRLLKKIHQALKPNGYFVFDVWTPENEEVHSNYKNWYACPNGGFWSADPFIELVEKVYYAEDHISLKQYTIIKDDGRYHTYNLWEKCFTVQSITQLLEENGFEVEGIFSNLTGEKYKTSSDTLGIVARRLS